MLPSAFQTDVLILGAGAAGLFCAIEAGKRGRRVVVLDHAPKPAEKIRISGGGRCNFTNLYTGPENFISQNPRFCLSALARYTPADFIALVDKHNISYHEKARGQLFCDGLSHQIIAMLLEECRQANVQFRLGTPFLNVSRPDGQFCVQTAADEIRCESLVVATGGLSIPKMGATNAGQCIARQFEMTVVPTQPALVPFTLSEKQLHTWGALSGVAVTASVSCNGQRFREGLLFTHRGLSGPAVLQISSYWEPGDQLSIDLAPERNAADLLLQGKADNPRAEITTALNGLLPKRLGQLLAQQHAPGRVADIPNRQLQQLGLAINQWQIVPNGTEGYRTAEVTLGGVDTAGLSSKTMESRRVPNLYFIGEVVDVTGHLGGFNFQWAWASGFVAGQYA